MSAANERLRGIELYNGYGIAREARRAGLSPVYVVRSAQVNQGLYYRPAKCEVIDVRTAETNLNGVVKTFYRWDGWSDSALAWAAGYAGIPIELWVKIPGMPGCWFPKSTADLVKRLLKEAGE